MMHSMPSKNKPLIDLTKEISRDWRDEIEGEIYRLNDIIKALVYQGGTVQ